MVNFYKCGACANVLLMMGAQDDTCSSKDLTLLAANTVDADTEKHVPVVSLEDGLVKVHVGAKPHPMLPEHYIQWVYIKTSYGGMFANLNPGDPPQATFDMVSGEVEEVYIYCNLHGLWKAKEPVLPLTYDTNNVACSAEFAAGCVDPSEA